MLKPLHGFATLTSQWILPLFVASAVFAQANREKPKYLEPWKEGLLDIHHINTGTGETTFFQMPDGTTMIVDTGIHGRDYNEKSAKPVPSLERQAGEWVARYIQSLSPNQNAKLDYTVLTHFDQDHIGDIVDGSKPAPEGDYILTGISEVIEHVPTAKILDRAYPDYNYPKPLEAKHIANYRKFVEYQVNKKGVKAERFVAGQNSQIVLTKNPSAYPNFKIQNLAVNGDVWTGQGTETKAYFPKIADIKDKKLPSENASSLAFKLSYGSFDYFTGGDLLGVIPKNQPAWFDLEPPVSKVTGLVDVVISNHHAYRDAMNETFLRNLAPRVMITLSWDNNHPHTETLPRMLSTDIYPGPRDLFITNLVPSARELLGEENAKQFKSSQGHIVVRVQPDGKSYMIYNLNDQSEDRFITAQFGPYNCQ